MPFIDSVCKRSLLVRVVVFVSLVSERTVNKNE